MCEPSEERCVFESMAQENYCFVLDVVVKDCGSGCKYFKSDKEYYLDCRCIAVKRKER